MHLSGSIFNAGNTYWEMVSTSSGWQSTCDFGRSETYTRIDDVLPTMSTGEETFNMADVGGSENDNAEDALLFAELPHRRLDHESASLDSSDLEVGELFSSKDSFLAALKQYNIKNGVNFYMVKFESKKLPLPLTNMACHES
ncbi:hypothetical protein J1N35_006060 [Gossypium stocksii]|uniref:Transposase MuDR plant domain-containing protein n=1 Tax=Gossypium stocksii TaxID=47602 RepID=A0A9D4AJU2_9ROSI|nr:hypothetical protein J1N35_006060 [Gossypium stocksii]